jgi:hypothetical protein
MIACRILPLSVVVILLLFCNRVSLHAQTIRGILYTKNNDTLEGQVRYKGPIELQNNGIIFVKGDKSETNYPPSSLKEAILFLSVFDTLRVLSMPKKIIEPFVENKAINEAPDTYLLFKTDLGNGPASLHSIYTGIKIIHAPAPPGQIGGWDKVKYLHTDFLLSETN